jgi:hypothetical protein
VAFQNRFGGLIARAHLDGLHSGFGLDPCGLDLSVAADHRCLCRRLLVDDGAFFRRRILNDVELRDSAGLASASSAMATASVTLMFSSGLFDLTGTAGHGPVVGPRSALSLTGTYWTMWTSM